MQSETKANNTQCKVNYKYNDALHAQSRRANANNLFKMTLLTVLLDRVLEVCCVPPTPAATSASGASLENSMVKEEETTVTSLISMRVVGTRSEPSLVGASVGAGFHSSPATAASSNT